MELLQILVLAVVQGITEFLPVSSSAHLILVPVLTNWEDQGLAFDVALHLGSLSAVMIYFRHEIATMTISWLRTLPEDIRGAFGGERDPTSRNPESALAWAVILGTIPVGLAGLAFEDLIESVLRSPIYLAVGMIFFGLILGWADLQHRGDRDEYHLRWQDVLVIGLAQAVALFPGTSRSGITMTAGLMLGLTRQAAARFSFLLSIPVILIACALKTGEMIFAGIDVDWTAMITGVILSGISAYLCIKFFLKLIERVGMMPFVIYRIALGLLLLWLFL